MYCLTFQELLFFSHLGHGSVILSYLIVEVGVFLRLKVPLVRSFEYLADRLAEVL